MKTIEYEQIWTMEDWIMDLDHIADRVFAEREEINWIVAQGYPARTTKYYDVQREVIHYKVCFDVPEQFITWLMIKYPNNKNRIEI